MTYSAEVGHNERAGWYWRVTTETGHPVAEGNACLNRQQAQDKADASLAMRRAGEDPAYWLAQFDGREDGYGRKQLGFLATLQAAS